MLKQSFSQKMNQKLSPQQIQLMKLFLVPTATIEQRIKEELEENPALDEGGDDLNEVFDINEEGEGDTEKPEEFELDDYINEYIEDDPSSYKLRGEVNIDEENRTMPMAVQDSFHEYLIKQINMMEFDSEQDIIIANQVIGSIDEDGYLRRAMYSIKDDLLFTQNIEVEEEDIQRIVKKIQQIEPIGVAAKDLNECLVLQLDFKLQKAKNKKAEDLDSYHLAMTILKEYFDEFSKKHYDKMIRDLAVTNDELRNAVNKILSLNPKPASSFATKNSVLQYVIPDFFISNNNGQLELSLNNRNVPDLRINDQYIGFIKNFKDNKSKTKSDKEAMIFVKKKIDGAKWFIDAIKQRHDTLYRTMHNIMTFQKEYFLTGDKTNVKPMILKDIAELTKLDISTISRVASSKFVQTEFGTSRLKDFFSEAIETTDGSEASTVKVKQVLKNIINDEDKYTPYSDEKLKELLFAKGYNMARRTIAKYREQLHIPVARLRKEL